MRAVQFDQLIVNAAISCGITSKPLRTFWAQTLKIGSMLLQ